MKPLHESCTSSLSEIRFIIEHIEDNYKNSEISQHVRHIVDHFLALKNGLKNNCVNYNQRDRNGQTESDAAFATEIIDNLINWIASLETKNTKIAVISEINCNQEEIGTFQSNRDRELLFLLNHTIHHAAYIKLLAKHQGIKLPENIGMAPATATYLRNQYLTS